MGAFLDQALILTWSDWVYYFCKPLVFFCKSSFFSRNSRS